jgi:hypothetical protein
MTGSTSVVAARRRKPWPWWLVVLVTITTTTAVVAIAVEVWSRSLPWPPLVSRGAALGIVMERDGLLPDGATWRNSGRAFAVRVFGVTDAAGQDRLIDGVRREIGSRGKPRGVDCFEIEFWSGDPPPAGENVWTEKPRDGSAVVRIVKVP